MLTYNQFTGEIAFDFFCGLLHILVGRADTTHNSKTVEQLLNRQVIYTNKPEQV